MKKEPRLRIRPIQMIIIICAIIFIIAGVLRDEHITVLEKAVRVCLECIGIG